MPKFRDKRNTVSLLEASRYLGVPSHDQLRKLVTQGKLPVVRVQDWKCPRLSIAVLNEVYHLGIPTTATEGNADRHHGGQAEKDALHDNDHAAE